MSKKTKPNKAQQGTYNQEFRETAIKLALAGDKPISEIAGELGMPVKRLYAWLSAWKKKNGSYAGSTASGTKSLTDDEVRRLQKRNKELELENEILKKASAYFARTLL